MDVGQVSAVGRVLGGRYRMDEPLGVGGMARVWRGHDLRLRRAVAIKELAGPWLADPTAISRFDREAWIGARLGHPNIVSVFDVGGHDASRYLVMELVEGQTVAEMLAAGPLPVDQAVTIAVQTCDGLAAAHAAGVVHRDIKPANLMVTPAGVVKICDFGIAKAPLDSADTGLTGPTYALGTSKFMAPEQPAGRIDARTDLYALGCTMYAMLTGDAPFDGRDTAEILQKHRNQTPAPLTEQRADVGPELEALVLRLLSKPPDARPSSAAEVKARLESLNDDPAAMAVPRHAPAPTTVSVRAVSPVPSRQGRSTLRMAASAVAQPVDDRGGRRIIARVLIVAGAFAVVSSVAALSAAVWKAASVEPERPHIAWGPTAATPTREATPSPEPPGSAPPTSTQLIRSPSSETVVLVSAQPLGDPITNLRLSIQQQVNTGHLSPDKASDLYKKVDEIAQATNAGNADDVRRKIQDFRNRIATLLAEGQLTAAGHDALTRDLDAIPLP